MTESATVFVPNETAAVSMGANEIAERIAATAAKKHNLNITIVRNGSWGMSWLEPLVEVSVDATNVSHTVRSVLMTSTACLRLTSCKCAVSTNCERGPNQPHIAYLEKARSLDFSTLRID